MAADELLTVTVAAGAVHLGAPEAMNPQMQLTTREREVVREIVAGRRNREIARELGIKEQAVKNVLSVVYQKCHVRNRLELAVFAAREHSRYESSRTQP